MKSRISNAYVKIFLYMLAGAAVGAVAGAGIYMLLERFCRFCLRCWCFLCWQESSPAGS